MPRRSGDYGGYGALLDQAAVEQQAAAAREPVACPNDGTPLVRNTVTGELRCPFDGWRPTP